MDNFLIDENGIYYKTERLALFPQNREMLYSDHFEKVDEGMFRWTRTIRIEHSELKDCLNFQMELQVNDEVNYYMIPGINYNGNSWGNGREPKGLCYEKQPWIFAYHRTTIPAGMFCQTEDYAIGMWACVSEEKKYSCTMSIDEKNNFHMSLLYPESESPAVYCARDQYEHSYQELIYPKSIDEETEIILEAIIVIEKKKDTFGYGSFLDAAWDYYEENSERINRLEDNGVTGKANNGVCNKADEEINNKKIEVKNIGKSMDTFLTDREVWERGFHFLDNYAYFVEKNFNGFCMGLSWIDGGWKPKKDYLEIGWVGQNASLAVSYLYQYAIEGNQNGLSKGLRILDTWLKYAVLPNGLFRCRFDKIQLFEERTDNREEVNDAANLYSVIEEYLYAYQLLQSLEIQRKEYLDMVLHLCDFIVSKQQEDGKLAKAWYNSGECADSEGTIGCYLAKGLCIAYEFCHKKAYLNAAIKALDFYYGEFMRNGYTTAGALDTCCIDKESAIPLLGTALKLYKLTKKEYYIDKCLTISNYLATWQYHYNVLFPEGTVLNQIGYKTRGGTSVSTQHHHIDCYGLEFYEDWIELSKITGNKIWKKRANALWENSLYNISDGSLVIKGQQRPKGSQDEGFLQTRWHTKKGEYFGVSEWLVVWNTAFRLKIIRKDYLAKKNGYSKEKKPL